MKFVGLVSGGKDSCFNILHSQANGHELVCLANLYPAQLEPGSEELDSFMYQTVGFPAVAKYGECMQVPLYREEIRGSAQRTSLDYEQTENDESEDLYRLLMRVKQNHPDVTAVSVGAILSTYQRLRVENVCRRLGLVSLAYLWLRDQAELLEEMTSNSGLNIMLIKAAGIGLGRAQVGQSLVSLVPLLNKLNRQYGFHLCGEGGEYETLVIDGPDFLFKKRLQIDSMKVVQEPSGDVCYVSVDTSIQDKNVSHSPEVTKDAKECVTIPPLFDEEYLEDIEGHADLHIKDLSCKLEHSSGPLTRSTFPTPSVQTLHSSGADSTSSSLWIANLEANTGDVAADIVSVLSLLDEQLSIHGFDRRSVATVSLLVRDLTPQSFGLINTEYSKFFSHSGPPARFCISPISSSHCPFTVHISALATNVAKESLHVESISYWAPANIGPYSQCMALSVIPPNSADMSIPAKLGLLSGQIGLIPSSMTVVDGVMEQAMLSFQHLLRVSKATSTASLLGAVAYVTSEEAAQCCFNIWRQYSGGGGNCDDRLIICQINALPREAQVEWSSWGLSTTSLAGWNLHVGENMETILNPPDELQLIWASAFISNDHQNRNLPKGPVEIVPVERIWYKAKIVPMVAFAVSVIVD